MFINHILQWCKVYITSNQVRVKCVEVANEYSKELLEICFAAKTISRKISKRFVALNCPDNIIFFAHITYAEDNSIELTFNNPLSWNSHMQTPTLL